MKFTMQRYKVALPCEDIDDPSAICRCTVEGSILVLKWSSMMLYMLVWANKRAATESIRALNLFLACTITVGQSDTSPMVQWLFEECPLHSSSSLLEEGSTSLKDQSCCLYLKKNLKGNPGW